MTRHDRLGFWTGTGFSLSSLCGKITLPTFALAGGPRPTPVGSSCAMPAYFMCLFHYTGSVAVDRCQNWRPASPTAAQNSFSNDSYTATTMGVLSECLLTRTAYAPYC